MSEETQSQFRPTRNLFKSSNDRMLDGVCGGIAGYLRVDTSIVRLVFVAVFFLSFASGVVIYLVCMLLMPPEPSLPGEGEAAPQPGPRPDRSGTPSVASGVVVIIVGLTFLFHFDELFSLGAVWQTFGRLALPLICVLAGGALLLQRVREPGAEAAAGLPATTPLKSTLKRSTRDRMISGVCGGVAEYFDVDATAVRILFVLLTIASLGLPLVVYALCTLTIPDDRT